ncbi:hypothetical protein A35E_00077 [secondary endosymbiont of Heteropsylla cubana]|uniref:Uncharacterized protein n=1 Tax=secondary endosymbiont of Heteropsylla cubana TaxID=134287 RepID=J3Z535_9ENTR|nr:hypothetical protein A35E_00077 [secondary endosymbiont of Heteropsylla cubana]
MKYIKEELAERRNLLLESGKIIEEQRLVQRIACDSKMMNELGYYSEMENYSHYLSAREENNPPTNSICLFSE